MSITLVSGTDLYRGPQPTAADVPWIKANIKTVIQLEKDSETVELAPVTIQPMTITPWQIYVAGISQEYLEEILGLLAYNRKPLLVHCQHGQDRTGLVIAAYRVGFCGWTKQAAMVEALSFGYHRWPLNIGLSKTWKDLQVR